MRQIGLSIPHQSCHGDVYIAKFGQLTVRREQARANISIPRTKLQAMLARDHFSPLILAVWIHRFAAPGGSAEASSRRGPLWPTRLVAQPTSFRNPADFPNGLEERVNLP
jgi:hypothetical protein